jgi:hypothetical protein
MSGDLRQSPTSHNDGTPIEPSRPPCAKNLLLGIAEIGKLATADTTEPEAEEASHFAEEYFLAAIIQAKKASKQDCEDCLEGRGILCPLKVEVEAETIPPRLKLLRKLSSVPDKRIRKLLKEGGMTGQKPQDRLLMQEMDQLGFWQPIPANPVTEPKPNSYAPTTDLVVADPRPAEGKERDYLATSAEKRPRCARTLSRFLVERYEAQTRWKKRNLGLPEEEKTDFKHQPSLKLYDSAVLASEETPELDCNDCLGENCPLKSGADGAELFDVTSTAVQIKGIKVKTRKRIINRLDGLPKEKMAGPPEPQLVAELIEGQLIELKLHPEQ